MFINSDKFSDVETVAPAGSTAADATAFGTVKSSADVTGADATKGIIAPSRTGSVMFVRNLTAAILKIYPPTGGTINGGAANAAYSLAASKRVLLVYSAKDTIDVFVSP